VSTPKSWPTVILGESTGRFTREQIREAVLSVKAEREAAAAARTRWPAAGGRPARLRARGLRIHAAPTAPRAT
jgi:hypothetical protein